MLLTYKKKFIKKRTNNLTLEYHKKPIGIKYELVIKWGIKLRLKLSGP